MVWSFFGLGHGKGVHDGTGAFLKQEIQKGQLSMNAQRLQNASDTMDFAKGINKKNIWPTQM
jgi:hypothetical protein